MKELRFYFDFLSPYAYFAWLRLPELARRAEIEVRPVPILLVGLLTHWGHRGPAEIPPKRAYVYRDVLRYARRHDLEIVFPDTHPFNPLLALRLASEHVAGPEQNALIDCLFRAIWNRGLSLDDPERVADVLQEAGFDAAALLERATQPEGKAALKSATAEALEAGAFGVPTFVVDGELFWGNDQFEHLERFLTTGDPGYDRQDLAEALARPSVQRG